MTRKPTCTNHCRGCGLHFHSAAAFDTHRIGSYSDPENPRRCAHPWDLPEKRYVTLTEHGLCASVEPSDGLGVTIWTLGTNNDAGGLTAR